MKSLYSILNVAVMLMHPTGITDAVSSYYPLDLQQQVCIALLASGQ